MAEFQATTEEQWALRRWLVARDGHATVESVVSGPGIVNIYEYLLARDGVSGDAGGAGDAAAASAAGAAGAARRRREREAKGGDGGSVLRGVAKEAQPATVADAGLAGTGDPRCREALDLFIAALAAHLRVTALHLLPTGGLYLCGGIPPRIVSRLRELLAPGLFVEDKVRVSQSINELNRTILSCLQVCTRYTVGDLVPDLTLT